MVDISRVKTWGTQEKFFAVDINAEFTNVYNNAVGKAGAQAITGRKTYSGGIIVDELLTIAAAGAGLVKLLDFRFDPASGTVTDNDGHYVSWMFDDDAGNETEYMRFGMRALDVSNGTEQGEFFLQVAENSDGALDEVLTIGESVLDFTSNQALTEVRIDNTATDGDPILAWQLGGTSQFTMGVDDGDSDLFKLGTTAIGTSTFLTISTSIVVFNEDGGNIDFRVEGDNVANGILLDAAQDALSFGGANVDGAAFILNNLQQRTAITSVGTQFHLPAQTTDFDNTSSTIAIGAALFLGIPTWTNANATLTMTDAVTLYIQGPPVDSTQVTATNTVLSLWVDAGASRFDGALDLNGAVQLDATLIIGVNDTGFDVQFFGATAGAHLLWDESADDLKLVGAAGLTVAGTAALNVTTTTTLTALGVVTVGVDDAGHDVQFFGATAGAHLLWDESADDLKLVGAAGLTVAGSTAVVGFTASSLLATSDDVGAIGASGTAWADLFLASGAVINFAAGDMTITHSSNLLTIAGGEVSVGAHSGEAFSVASAEDSNYAVRIQHTDADNPFGLFIRFGGGSPDDNTAKFLQCSDTTAVRTEIFSDGDVATADAGTLTSDQRLKTKIVDATPKLADLMKLRVRNFEWIPEYHPNKVGEKKIGFIAQEVEKVFPSLISENDIAPEGADPWIVKNIRNAFVPMLVKGLQELTERVESLEAA